MSFIPFYFTLGTHCSQWNMGLHFLTERGGGETGGGGGIVLKCTPGPP